jgi:hypothetical protein
MSRSSSARFGAAAGWLLLAASLLASTARPVRAEPGATPEQTAPAFVGLQSPEQRSTRYSAYSLPKNAWSIDAGALGVSGDELYGRIGVAYGLAGRFQLDLNLLHWSAALFGLDARWTFLDTRYLAISASVGVVYGHGAWMWFLAPTAQKIVSDTNLFSVPFGLTASAPLTRWLQIDLRVEYQYSEYFGELGNGAAFYATSQIGARQLMLRPALRFFLSDASALELATKLPLYTKVPIEIEGARASRSSYAEAKFSDGWNVEAGLRSRLQPWLYATVRLHYGRVAKALYGAPLYPSFDLELRL